MPTGFLYLSEGRTLGEELANEELRPHSVIGLAYLTYRDLARQIPPVAGARGHAHELNETDHRSVAITENRYRYSNAGYNQPPAPSLEIHLCATSALRVSA